MLAHLMREALDRWFVEYVANALTAAAQLDNDANRRELLQHRLELTLARYDEINKLMVRVLNAQPNDEELQHT